MFLTSTTTFLAIIFGIIAYVYRHRRYYGLIMKLPGPTAIPIIGDFILICRKNHEIAQALGAPKTLDPPIFRLLGSPILIVTSRLEDIELILKSPLTTDKGPVGAGLAEVLGPRNIIVDDWPAMQHPKKILIRAFVQADQKIVFNSFQKEYQKLKQVLDKGAYFDTKSLFKTYTVSALVGSCLPVCENELLLMIEKMKPIVPFADGTILRGISVFHKNDFLFNNFFGGNKLKAALKEYYSYGDDIINRKRKELSDFFRKGENPPNVYLYNIMQEMQHSSNQEILSELLTVLISGEETSAVTAAFALVLLGMHPDIQQKVYEEGCKVREEEKVDEMTQESLAKCLYLGRVVKEVLRMYPAVPIFPRVNKEEIKLGKYDIPRGSVILAAVLTLHRNPAYYENPSTMNPDRFLPENFAKIPKYAYLPFGSGPRSCPGYFYGTTSAMYLVSTIVHSYKVYTKHRSIEELDYYIKIMTNLSDRRRFPIRMERRRS